MDREIRRAIEQYNIGEDHLRTTLQSKILYAIEDHLSALPQQYPFRETEFGKLSRTIKQQYNYVIGKLRDFQHIAIKEAQRGCMDWAAAPYFKGADIKLSTVLADYASFHHRRTPIQYELTRTMLYIEEEDHSNQTHEKYLDSDYQPSKRSRESDDDTW